MDKQIRITITLPDHIPAASLAFLASEIREYTRLTGGSIFRRETAIDAIRDVLATGLGALTATEAPITVDAIVTPDQAVSNRGDRCASCGCIRGYHGAGVCHNAQCRCRGFVAATSKAAKIDRMLARGRAIVAECRTAAPDPDPSTPFAMPRDPLPQDCATCGYPLDNPDLAIDGRCDDCRAEDDDLTRTIGGLE